MIPAPGSSPHDSPDASHSGLRIVLFNGSSDAVPRISEILSFEAVPPSPEPIETVLVDATTLPETGQWNHARELAHHPQVEMVSLYARHVPPDWVRDGVVDGPGGDAARPSSQEAATATPCRTERPPDPTASRHPERGSWPGKEDGLSEREVDVLVLIANGESNESIARLLNISMNTVKTYIRSAYHKIQVSTRSQAVRWSVEHGLCGHRPRVVNGERWSGGTER